MFSCAKIQKFSHPTISISYLFTIFAQKSREMLHLIHTNMRFNFRYFSLLLIVLLAQTSLWADELPSVSPTVTFTTFNGETSSEENFSGSAPIKGSFLANPSHADGWTAYYEWRIFHDQETEPYIIRYEENTDVDFTQSGTHRIVLYAKFTQGDNVYEYLTEDTPFSVTVSESQLEMPNAFSPNGDGINDIYKAKSGYQSIVEFHAYIFNRWGQKLYEWNDPAGGWDGTYKGHDVKDGVYFVLVKAKGADGKEYNIKRDVNLLRGYIENQNNN